MWRGYIIEMRIIYGMHSIKAKKKIEIVTYSSGSPISDNLNRKNTRIENTDILVNWSVSTMHSSWSSEYKAYINDIKKKESQHN